MTEFHLDLPSWADITPKRRTHVERVGALIAMWADAMEVPELERARWFRAANLHDAVKDADPERLRALAPDAWGADSLRHGPAAAVLAAREGEVDSGILDAVRYHSVGYGGWERVGRMLYMADFLEPGRNHGGLEVAAAVPGDPVGILREVARRRIEMTVSKYRRLLPETVAFWNGLCGDSFSF
jgi:HD superfamily phosphohydrolase YqeK